MDEADDSVARAASLPGLEFHPHARAVLAGALGGAPSHAYLFHGPAGAGKRAVARELAATLLAEGAPDPEGVRARVRRGAHPDLTWVSPSGAAEMLVSDIDAPVVAAAVHTPFEAARRVFVIESVQRMNDQAANRMLKTLEEPAPFVHIVLICERREDVLPTIASRCLHVRFDPLPAHAVAERLEGVPAQTALACARLAQGDAGLAALLAADGGAALRHDAEAFVHAALTDELTSRPWAALLDGARAAGATAAERADAELAAELELLPVKERRRVEREGQEARRRAERRARTAALDLGLRVAELWLRDLVCVRAGAVDVVLAVDRVEDLERDAAACDPVALRRGAELVADTRLSLALNVAEELALEALAYRLQTVLAPALVS